MSGQDSFRRRRIVFAGLNAAVLAILLSLHTAFAFFWGRPPLSLIALLGGALLLRVAELSWFLLPTRNPRSRAAGPITVASIVLNLVLAAALASVLDREDSQYFALLALPVLEGAFQFSLPAVLAVVAAADSVTFYWVWRYDTAHPPVNVGEYFEAGTISLIFAIVAVLVALLVRQLGGTIDQLQAARERLLEEEKLAAVGRLGSAVAHEIRNPVAIIKSSLATAKLREGSEREEMLEIAGKEAARLVGLTTDFLNYARPRRPHPAPQAAADVARYAAEVCRPRAEAAGVRVEVEAADEGVAEFDAGMVQQAVLNLVLNAVEASPAGSAVTIAVRRAGEQVHVEVENPGGPVPECVTGRLFEPFCTSKPGGTGLGLATARGIARAHGGDLVLSRNLPGQVRFCLMLPVGRTVWAESWL